jgi:hypothetical protein
MFWPSQSTLGNHVFAACHRFACHMPDPAPARERHLLAFAKAYIPRLYVRPTSGDVNPDFEYWAARARAGPARIQLLRTARHSLSSVRDPDVISDMFIKFEAHPKPKAPRSINAPPDRFKAAVCADFRWIDKATFAARHYVKTVPVAQRARHIFAAFGARPCVSTDYTSFEAHHHGCFAEIGQIWIDHITAGHPGAEEIRQLFRVVHAGPLRFMSSRLRGYVRGRMPSGVQWTSSANGNLNCVLTAYLRAVTDLGPHATVDELVDYALQALFFVEGDDGVCEGGPFNSTVIDELGIVLVSEPHQHVGEASFCGIVGVPGTDTSITDPLKMWSKLFTLPAALRAHKSTTAAAYVRCKCLSAIHQYPAAPMVSALARAGLRKTHGVDPRAALMLFDEYEREQIVQALDDTREQRRRPPGQREPACPIDIAARETVERLFSIDIGYQLSFELAVCDWGEREGPADTIDWHPRLQQWIANGHHTRLREADERAPRQQGQAFPVNHCTTWLHDVEPDIEQLSEGGPGWGPWFHPADGSPATGPAYEEPIASHLWSTPTIPQQSAGPTSLGQSARVERGPDQGRSTHYAL